MVLSGAALNHCKANHPGNGNIQWVQTVTSTCSLRRQPTPDTVLSSISMLLLYHILSDSSFTVVSCPESVQCHHHEMVSIARHKCVCYCCCVVGVVSLSRTGCCTLHLSVQCTVEVTQWEADMWANVDQFDVMRATTRTLLMRWTNKLAAWCNVNQIWCTWCSWWSWTTECTLVGLESSLWVWSQAYYMDSTRLVAKLCAQQIPRLRNCWKCSSAWLTT